MAQARTWSFVSALQLLLAGNTAKSVAGAVGCDVNALYQALHRRGLTLADLASAGPGVTVDDLLARASKRARRLRPVRPARPVAPPAAGPGALPAPAPALAPVPGALPDLINDAALAATGGRYADLAAYAQARGLTLVQAQARWHRRGQPVVRKVAS